MLSCFTSENQNAVTISLVTPEAFPVWLATQSDITKNWLNATQFRPDVGQFQLLPNENGALSQVVCCIADKNNPWSIGHLPLVLPQGIYQLEVDDHDFSAFAIGWGLGAYQFTRYKKPLRLPSLLYLKPMFNQVQNMVESIYNVRDWINIPTENMGPSEFAKEAKRIAQENHAELLEIVGDDLLKQNYPAIHAVGRASDDPPRLLDLRWGNKAHPKVTLVGKGVCFDTGGLDIKPSQAMLLMKKDMAGGAHVLGLARMIMQANLPICLRVLIPVVENVISGNAYRPGDVVPSRKGVYIEIGNTDAEGRVVLADALTEAVSDEPDLLIDISTLTGAARIALGTELPVVFSNKDDLVSEVTACGEREGDLMWRLPLYGPYRELINSTIADINNNASEPYGGAITAALFLKEFVPDSIPWLHFDLMAWNLKTKPGRPQGGEAMVLRALFCYLMERFY